MDESDEEEEAFLLLCLGFSATATRMLMTCTWKYMDLQTTGNKLVKLCERPPSERAEPQGARKVEINSGTCSR